MIYLHIEHIKRTPNAHAGGSEASAATYMPVPSANHLLAAHAATGVRFDPGRWPLTCPFLSAVRLQLVVNGSPAATCGPSSGLIDLCKSHTADTCPVVRVVSESALLTQQRSDTRTRTFEQGGQLALPRGFQLTPPALGCTTNT